MHREGKGRCPPKPASFLQVLFRTEKGGNPARSVTLYHPCCTHVAPFVANCFRPVGGRCAGSYFRAEVRLLTSAATGGRVGAAWLAEAAPYYVGRDRVSKRSPNNH